MRTSYFKLVAVILAAYTFAGPAAPRTQAGFLAAYSGNTQMSDVNSPRDVVSFSVFQKTGAGTWLTELNTALGTSLTASSISGGGTLDLNAKYVYMYQVVNLGTTATPTSTFETLKVANPAAFTSAGYFSGKVFVDAQGNVGATTAANVAVTNKGLGIDPTVDDVAGNGTPSHAGTIPSSIATQSTRLFDWQSTDLAFGGSDDYVTFTILPSQLKGAGTTSIVFLTSNHGPIYAEGITRNGGESNGDIPTAVTPEPGSLVLWGLGGLGLLGFYHRRRQSLTAPAQAS